MSRLSYKTLFTAVFTLLIGIVGLIRISQKPYPATAGWFDDGWQYRKSITVTNNTSTETNKYIQLTLNISSTANAQADDGDFRFTKVNGQLLPYYLVSGTGTTNVVVNIQLDSFPAGTQIIYGYYDNPNAPNGFSITNFSSAASNYTIGSLGSQETGGGPVVYWKFDEGVGSTAYDSTTRGVNLNLAPGNSTPTWISEDQCISGKCLKLNGNSYLTVSAPTLVKSTTRTVSFWVKPSIPTTHVMPIVSLASANYYLGFSANGKLISSLADVGGTQVASYSPGNEVATNTWKYVTFVIDTAGNNVNVSYYVNGIFLETDATTNGHSTSFGSTLYIGALSGSSYFFNGYLDDLKIYSYVRTAAQIKSDYNSRNSSKGSSSNLGASNKSGSFLSDGLIGYWKMDENVGTTTLDASGNSNTGTFGTGNSAPSWVGGKFGTGTSFGSNDYISIGTTLSSVQTISLRFYPSTTSPSLLQLSSSVNIGASASTVYTVGISSPTIFIDGLQTTSIGSTNTWHQLTITSPSAINANQILFGQVGTNFLIGSLDEVRLYNRVLEPREVSQLYSWTPGPILYWNTEENSGSLLNDISGNNYPGTATSTTTTQGKFGHGRRMSTGESISASSQVIPSNGTARTVSVWVKMANNSTFQTIAASGNIGSSSNHAFGIGTDIATGSKFSCVSYKNIPGNSRFAINGTTTIIANTWYHVSCTWDGQTTANGVNLYVNGILEAQGTANAADSATYNSNFGLGTNYPILSGGVIDEIKIYNYARTQKQVIEDMNAGHPAGGSPVGSQLLYWKMDEGQGSVAHNSGSSNSIFDGTIYNGAWSSVGKYNKSLGFNGTSTYVQSVATTLPNTFTFTSWFNVTSFVDWAATVTNLKYSAPASGLNIIPRPGVVRICYGDGTNGYSNYNVTVSEMTTGQWFYAAATYDGINIKLYIDGKLRDSRAATVAQSSQTIRAGLWASSYNDYFFNGLIDDTKVYNYALTADEIKLDYNRGQSITLGSLSSGTGNTSPSTSNSQVYCIPGDTATCSTPVIEWNFEEGVGTTAYDSSSNNNNGIFGAGSSAPSWAIGKVGNAAQFNSSNNTFISSSTNPGTLSSGTYSLWVKPSNNNVAQGWIDSVFDIFQWTGNLLYFRAGNQSAISISNLDLNKWHHVAMTWNGSNYYGYLDGTQVASGVQSGNQSGVISIGRVDNGYHYQGGIDQVRIYNYARTPAQVAWDYNKGSPVGWWKLDECQGSTASDSSSVGNTGVISIGASGSQNSLGTCSVGTSTAWTNGSIGKFNSSLSFDGTDDYVSIPSASGSVLDPGSSDFTVSAWVYRISSGTNIIIGKRVYPPGYVIYYTGSSLVMQLNDASPHSYTLGTQSDFNTWHLITTSVKRSTNQLFYYLDGKLINTIDISATTGSLSNAGYVGFGRDQSDASSAFGGKIDDIRIYNYPLTSTQIQTLYNNGSVNFGPASGSP